MGGVALQLLEELLSRVVDPFTGIVVVSVDSFEPLLGAEPCE